MLRAPGVHVCLQVDKDKSGTVDAEEFAAWLKEMDQTQKRLAKTSSHFSV
eukprot:COSAG01_NODE_10367_length_2183_cov_3.327255_2_plen_49_part_01